MYDFEKLLEPTSLTEAITVRSNHPDALLIAGGTDVLIKMR